MVLKAEIKDSIRKKYFSAVMKIRGVASDSLP